MIQKFYAFMLFGALTLSPRAFAACHVVSSSGSGTNSGADWSNAMNKLPATLTRGDTYYLADSAAYAYGAYTFNTSGSTLTFVKKAQASDHCTDTGWNAGTMGSAQASFKGMSFAAGASGSNFTVDGNGSYAGAGCGGGPSPGTDKINPPANPKDCGIIIDDNFCSSSCDFVMNISGSGGPATTGVTLKYMEWYGNFRNTEETSFLWAWGSAIANSFTIQHVYAHNTGCTYIHQDGGIRSESYSYFYALDSNGSGCHGEATYDVNGTTVTDFNNVYRDIVGSAVHWFDGSTFAHGHFYNNRYWVSNPAPSWVTTNGTAFGTLACANASTCSDFLFYNNVTVNFQGGFDAGVNLNAGGGTCTSCFAKDNLWYNTSHTIHISLNGVTEDYNSFLNMGNTDCCNTGAGVHDVNVASGSADPFVSWTGGDFHVAAENSNWTNRVSLGSPYDTDPDGVARTSDRGVFQFVGAPASIVQRRR